ncbi:MAG: hypothetical protein J7456_16105 [Chloroflexus sp.]|jgi:uncharacterized protein YukE|nr:hypothetical protein [Chloroflexus sp.]
MSRLNDAISQLETDWNALVRHWEEVKQVWDDEVRREFEQKYWEELKSHMTKVRRELEHLQVAINSAKRRINEMR